jgi:NAD-dependent SIR2 family protein deacetylase
MNRMVTKSCRMSESESDEEDDTPRVLLPSFTSIKHVVEAVEKAKNIIVITGAGISVSCGIPDFRSKDIGIYNTLDCEKYNIPSPELLFDYEFFRIDAEPFYKFAHFLLPNDNVKPSPCHDFIASLEARGKLLRNYTQNVDGLERKAGISKVVECHGSMMYFRCLLCSKRKKLETVRSDVLAGNVVYCAAPSCGGVYIYLYINVCYVRKFIYIYV